RQGGRTPARSLLLARLVDLLLDLRLVDAFAVPLECALPRGDRLVRAPLLQPQIPEVILDDRVLRQLAGGGAERPIGEIDLPLLEVGPAEAVQVRRVAGVELDGAAADPDGFVAAGA